MEVFVILAVVGFAAYFLAESVANRKRAAEKTKKTEDEKRQEAYEDFNRAATRDLLDRIYADHSADMRSAQRDIDELNSWLRDAEDRLKAENNPPA